MTDKIKVKIIALNNNIIMTDREKWIILLYKFQVQNETFIFKIYTVRTYDVTDKTYEELTWYNCYYATFELMYLWQKYRTNEQGTSCIHLWHMQVNHPYPGLFIQDVRYCIWNWSFIIVSSFTRFATLSSFCNFDIPGPNVCTPCTRVLKYSPELNYFPSQR